MKIKLGDICTFQSGGTPTKGTEEFFNGTIPWITTTALNGGKIDGTQAVNWITEKAIEKSAAKLVPAFSIMVGTRVGVGKVAVNTVQMSTSQDIISLINIDENRWDKDYLCKYIQGKNAFLNSQARGATIKGIKMDVLANLELEEITLENQARISETIDRVKVILDARKNELLELDKLVKARFVEMFGSYECTTTVGNYIAELRGGKSLSGTTPCKNKVLKTGAATFGWFDPKQYKYLPQDYEPLPEHKVEAGDVMISRMNTPELVGACSYVFEAPEDMYYPDRLWKVIPKNQANSIFIWQLLWDPEIRRKIKEKSGGTSGTMHNISKAKLLELECIDVPVNEQNRFADFVKQINKSKAAVQKSLDETQVLFDSLMQKYFG